MELGFWTYGLMCLWVQVGPDPKVKNVFKKFNDFHKSSVSFLLLKYKEKIRSSCSRQNHYMTCKNKHTSNTALAEILLDLHHRIARLAWLIQGHLFLVKKNQNQH